VDIRTKLVFALVGVSLVSMLAFGAIMYTYADGLLEANKLEQLDGLAQSELEAMEKVVSGWRERVQLIASRTQLRLSLRDHNQGLDPSAPDRIRRILVDALSSVSTVEAVAVYDAQGRLVASDPEGIDPRPREDELSDRPITSTLASYGGITFLADGRPSPGFTTNLVLDGEWLGTVHTRFNTRELDDLTQSFAGLGSTGEVMIVMRDPTGTIRVLHPVRHLDDALDGLLALERPDDPAAVALKGGEGGAATGFTDYRGQAVWAATRYLPETGWGIVVKFDEDEELDDIGRFRQETTGLATGLAAFAILVAVFVGLRFARPIHDLADVANRIRKGEFEARVEVRREDEVGLLARTFNQMADELEDRLKLLREFKTFFDLSLDMLCIASTDGYFKRTNPAFERTLGWDRETLISKPFLDLVHPDDVQATLDELEKLAQGIPTIQFDHRFQCADGTYKRLRWTSHPEPETGLLYAAARVIDDAPAPS
jgi:PAS domain S-box-containing protein